MKTHQIKISELFIAVVDKVIIGFAVIIALARDANISSQQN